MKTYMATAESVERKWYLVDATDMPLGRVASQVAAILRGKNKPTFTPNVDCGDYVIIINTDKVVLTGKKLEKKMHRHHTGHVGGLKEVSYKILMQTKSDVAVYDAVKGMLPKTKLGVNMMKKCKSYKCAEHKHEAQQPIVLQLVK
ncbi:MAG: 50S ribosomal protein L13 [Clostridia bacterium]|nr:50S ribosomal protein L13 [Clostridia bacterium]